ncbi:MAG: hypothetical protein RIR70_179 [Pseudomonadota bacterium]
MRFPLSNQNRDVPLFVESSVNAVRLRHLPVISLMLSRKATIMTDKA